VALVRFMLLALTFGTLGSAFADNIPDLSKTPGAVRAGLTKQKICPIKWGKDERHLTAAMKRQVFESYGYTGNHDPKCVPDKRGRHCEIDHLNSREPCLDVHNILNLRGIPVLLTLIVVS